MTLNTVSFSQEEFTSLRDILLEHTGISIADHKQTLMEGRLIKRLRKLGISTCREYIEYLYSTESEKSEFINLMTTNKTEFFREAHHFDFINQIAIPELLKLTGRRSIDIWSAASAIGEEAYTLAIVLNEILQAHTSPSGFRILGSDIDTHVLELAQKGIYNNSSVEEQVPLEFIRKYFLRGTGKNTGFYKINPELKKWVKFKQYNLLFGEFEVPLQFDIVFLRNVLIYFNQQTISIVISRVTQLLRPGGYLVISSSETLNGIQHPLQSITGSIYKRPGK